MSTPPQASVPVTTAPVLTPAQPSAQAWLGRWVPALEALRTYSWSALGCDAAAGLTVAAVAVPQSMAYAALAGLSPQYGLYTAIVMTAVGAVLDSSRLLINGPTNAISIALLSALTLVPEGQRVQAAILLAMMVGVIQLVIALLRFGNLMRYVSSAVVVGFTVGASTLLVLDQTRHLLGLPQRGGDGDHFLTRFWLSMTAIEGIHPATTMVGAGTIAVIILVRQLNNALRARRARFPVPQHLVAVILMGLCVWALRLDQEGVEVVGEVPSGLPALQTPPWRWDHCRLLTGSALAIALLGLMEALAMAKAIAIRTGQPLDVNQQCLSEGAANLAGSFFQCFPGSGSLTRSAVNQQAGAVSQWSGVFAAAYVAMAVVAAAPLAYFIPRASLAGILILAAYRMVDFHQLVRHLRASKVDAGVIIGTALSAVLISIEFCILIGVLISAVLTAARAARWRWHGRPRRDQKHSV